MHGVLAPILGGFHYLSTEVLTVLSVLHARSLDPRIVPDAKWPGMYRIRRPHGSLSDMPNLTRIQRCPARNGSPHAGSADTEGSMSQEMAPLAAREFRDRIVGLDRLLRP